MTNKPEFWRAFQALAKMRKQMAQDFYNKFVAYQAYTFMFKNEDVIVRSVLAKFSSDDAKKIYEDTEYGMNTVAKLALWVQAYYGEKTSENYQAII